MADGSELEVTVGGEPITAELPSGVRTGGLYTFGAGGDVQFGQLIMMMLLRIS